MREELLEKLFEYIDARIDDKIESAFGRDRLYESIRVADLKTELKELAFNLQRP